MVQGPYSRSSIGVRTHLPIQAAIQQIPATRRCPRTSNAESGRCKGCSSSSSGDKSGNDLHVEILTKTDITDEHHCTSSSSNVQQALNPRPHHRRTSVVEDAGSTHPAGLAVVRLQGSDRAKPFEVVHTIHRYIMKRYVCMYVCMYDEKASL